MTAFSGDREINLSEVIHTSESFYVEKAGPSGEIEGVSIAREGPDPRVAHADLNGSGDVVDSISHPASPKQDAELRAARLYVQRRNLVGESWEEPLLKKDDEPEQGVDCTALGPDGKVLKIQVTTDETEAWRVLARSSQTSFERSQAVADVVQAMRDAIERKHLKGHPDIDLLIDATDSPAFVIGQVVDGFRQTHGRWARGPFREVWVVGPTVGLVWRLDS
jgi:hypothetical protein